MEKMLIRSQSCKGCGYCVANCPKGAAALEGPMNKAGYTTPAVDKEKCVLCGICYTVCPDCVYEFVKEEA
jgi:2-oxoglutarate ferredoxin oxidoreductase subunit delta